MRPKAAALLSLSLVLSAPSTRAVTPGDEYALTSRQISALAQQATAGDRKATFQLVQFYLLYQPDLGKATHWQRVAAKQGDIGQTINLATNLSIAGGKANCLEAQQWLLLVEKSADDRLATKATRELKLLRAEGKCARWLAPKATSNKSFKPNPLRGSA